MRLKNKKTGEIKDVESLGHEESLRDKYGPQITLSWNTEYENLGECRTYNSLAELNEEWEDYEEPKEYWYIDYDGGILCGISDNSSAEKMMISMGNHFETIEEAEKAVEKLKAWKRLKDRGFRFNRWTIPEEPKTPHIKLVIEAEMDVPDSPYDLDLLFGGEE